MAQRIQLRRGTSTQWTAVDPVLAIGEPGFETDTGLLKIGDGTTVWSSLRYFGPSPGPTHAPAPDSSPDPGARLDARILGIPNDGAEDATASIQAALDMHVPVTFGAGSYRTTGSLLVDSGADIEIADGAVLVKDFAAGTGTNASWIRNRDFGVKIVDIKISGPGRIEAASAQATGNLICLHGDDMELRDVSITRYAGGRAVTIAGDRARLYNLTISGSPAERGTGGIRYIGGDNFRCFGAQVESGDDCLQLVPAGARSDPLFDRSISDAFYIGCTAHSLTARPLVAALQAGADATPGDVLMGASIVNSGWTACGGSGVAAALAVQNYSSSGAISNIAVTDCVIDMSSGSAQAGEISVRASSAGSVSNIYWTRGRIVSPQYSTVKLVGPVDNVTFTDLDCERGAQGATLPVLDLTGTNTAVIGGVIDGHGTPADVISVAPNDAMTDPATPIISPREVRGIANLRSGVHLRQVAAPRVVNGKYRPTGGSGTARAITVGAGTTDALIIGNDVTGFVRSGPILDSGTGSIIANNAGQT